MAADMHLGASAALSDRAQLYWAATSVSRNAGTKSRRAPAPRRCELVCENSASSARGPVSSATLSDRVQQRHNGATAELRRSHKMSSRKYYDEILVGRTLRSCAGVGEAQRKRAPRVCRHLFLAYVAPGVAPAAPSSTSAPGVAPAAPSSTSAPGVALAAPSSTPAPRPSRLMAK